MQQREFTSRTLEACINQCSIELRKISLQQMPGFARAAAEGFPPDDARHDTMNAWIENRQESLDSSSCHKDDLLVSVPEVPLPGAKPPQLEPGRQDPLKVFDKPKKKKKKNNKGGGGKGFSFALPSVDQLRDDASRLSQNGARIMQRYFGGGGGEGRNERDRAPPGLFPGAGWLRPVGVR